MVRREEIIGGQRLICGDALAYLPTIPDSSVDLIATDPPYFRVKNLPWDRQWEDAASFIAWIGKLCEEWRRVLKPNGSLYVFASPKMAARVECEVGRWFDVLNGITWRKQDGTANEGGLWSRANKESLRRFFEQGERIIFAEQFGADSAAKGEAGYGAACDELRGFVFEPLRAYLDGERRRAGVNFEQVREAVGCAAGSGLPSHWFTQSQWILPTATHYAALQELFNRDGTKPVAPYEEFHDAPRERFERDLRADYSYLRADYEDLRRPFTVTADVPYTDVWDFPTVNAYPGKHPCEKPEALLSHIIKTSSRPGDLVLDCFAGGGSTGSAAAKSGRRFIGVELDKHWVAIAGRRIAAATAQTTLPGLQDEPQLAQGKSSDRLPKCE